MEHCHELKAFYMEWSAQDKREIMSMDLRQWLAHQQEHHKKLQDKRESPMTPGRIVLPNQGRVTFEPATPHDVPELEEKDS